MPRLVTLLHCRSLARQDPREKNKPDVLLRRWKLTGRLCWRAVAPINVFQGFLTPLNQR
jgi:hypothetical protein